MTVPSRFPALKGPLRAAVVAFAVAGPAHGTTVCELRETAPVASCVPVELLCDGEAVKGLPTGVVEALECPQVASVHGSMLTLRTGDDVRLFDAKTGLFTDLFSLHPGMDGISGPVRSADGKRMVFLVVNQQRTHGYTEQARLIAVEEAAGEVSLQKFNRPVHFSCGSSCFGRGGTDFGFTKDGALFFRRHELHADRPGTIEVIPLPANGP